MGHSLICPLGSESMGWQRKGMQPDQTPFLCPAPLGPSNPLFSNKIISLQVPTLLSGMATPPKHLFSSSPSSAFSYPSSSSRKLSRTQKRTEDCCFHSSRLGSTPPTCCCPIKDAES